MKAAVSDCSLASACNNMPWQIDDAAADCQLPSISSMDEMEQTSRMSVAMVCMQHRMVEKMACSTTSALAESMMKISTMQKVYKCAQGRIETVFVCFSECTLFQEEYCAYLSCIVVCISEWHIQCKYKHCMPSSSQRKRRRVQCLKNNESIGSQSSLQHDHVTTNAQEDQGDATATQDDSGTKSLLLSHYNSFVESLIAGKSSSAVQASPQDCLPDSMWEEWLWGTDALQECSMDVMMNRMHLLGLLIARYRACMQERFKRSNLSLIQMLSVKNDGGADVGMKQLCLFDSPVRTYSIRQLMDTLLNLQVLNCSGVHMPIFIL